MSFLRKAAGCQNSLFLYLSSPSVRLSSHSCLLTFFLWISLECWISPRPSCSLCVCMCASVCVLWCVLQFRTLKHSKIPLGEETQVRSAGGVTTETSWCWQTCLCLCLSFFPPSCFLSYSLFPSHNFYLSVFFFLLFLLNCQYPYHNMSSSATPSLLSNTFYHRVSAVLSQCRCGSTSCVGSVATCGRSFRQTWPRRCSARCYQRLYSCWCRDTPGPVLHTIDTCKSGTRSCAILASYFHYFIIFTWEIFSLSAI